MGSVFCYIDPLVSSQPRWYILVGIDKDILCFVYPQKNVEGRLKARNETREAPKTVVILKGREDYSELSMESVVDCNTVFRIAKAVLVKKCKEEAFDIRPECPEAIYKRILVAIESSKEVVGLTMNIIRKSNLTSS